MGTSQQEKNKETVPNVVTGVSYIQANLHGPTFLTLKLPISLYWALSMHKKHV